MSTEAWLDDLLPTKWARRVAAATLGFAVGAYNLPLLFPPSIAPATPELLFSLRIILALLAAVVGLVIVLGCVVVRTNELQKQANRSFWEVSQ